MECPPTRAQAWLDEHGPDLDGLTAEDAASLVEHAGLQPRVLPHPGGRITQELRHDRVNLWLTADGAVGATDAG